MLDLLRGPEQTVCRDETPSRRLCSLHSTEAGEATPVDGTAGRLPLLLVEKDAAMRAMLCRMLSSHYQVEAVNDARAARQAVKYRSARLVVIDLYQPGTDDLALIQSLRAEAAAALLPIVMLTTSADRDLLLRCLAVGATNFLLKPFVENDLLTCLQLELELRAPANRAA